MERCKTCPHSIILDHDSDARLSGAGGSSRHYASDFHVGVVFAAAVKHTERDNVSVAPSEL